MFLSPFLPPSQSTQQPFASVTSSNSTVSMATTPSPARVADTPGGASTPGLLLVATCSFVLLSIVAGVIIQAEHISDGCTSDFAVAAAAVAAAAAATVAAAATAAAIWPLRNVLKPDALDGHRHGPYHCREQALP